LRFDMQTKTLLTRETRIFVPTHFQRSDRMILSGPVEDFLQMRAVERCEPEAIITVIYSSHEPRSSYVSRFRLYSEWKISRAVAKCEPLEESGKDDPK
jgi:hypothetical protein